MSQISFQNSLTTRDIISPFTFEGEYVDITAYAEVNVLLQGILSLAGDYYVVTTYLSNDRVNVLETIETNVTYPISNKLIKITPIANFIKIKLETFALDVITNFNMSTVLRSVLPLSSITNIDGIVEVSNFPTEFNSKIIESIALDTNVLTLPVLNITNTEFNSKIIESIALDTNVLTLPVLNITNTEFNSKIIESIALDTNVLTLPVLNITNTEFNSKIIESIALDTNVLTLPVLNITNTEFNSKIIESIKLDTNIKTIDTAVTFQCQERPTTESYFTTSVGSGGLAITLSPKTLRNFSINTTSSVIIYVYLYDTGLAPVPGDVPKFVFPIKDANNIVFNSFDHRFENGIGIRATTTYNGVIAPTANSVFVNMTLSN